ncbi:MAG: methylmalonyl-CoA mutase family protein, partial [Adhaeribacter sp.]
MTQQARAALFPAFKSFSPPEWEEKIRKDLKGRELSSLCTATPEGITLRPFYTRTDLPAQACMQNPPGSFPYIRGHKTKANAWQYLEALRAEGDGRAAIDRGRQALDAGADGIHFTLTQPETFDLAYLAGQINLSQVPVAYTLPEAGGSFLLRLDQELQHRHLSPHSLKGFVLLQAGAGIAPAGPGNLEEVVEHTREATDFYGVTVNGAQFGSQGATAVQEIAFTLSLAVQYLEQLSSRGLALSTIFRNLQVSMGTGTHFFMEIAKLRALRWLWAGIVRAFEEDPELAGYLRIHALSSSWLHTTFDPHSNILRTTTEAMSAILGGCDSLTVRPFDALVHPDNPFSARIARNIPLILKHEACLDQVLDPAGGSYYVERLTQELAEKAWELFQQTQAKGGFAAALASGFIREQLQQVAQAQFQAIAAGRQVLVGTNKYADPKEKPGYDAEALLQSRDFDTSRASYPFEVMRLAAMLHFQKKNARPKAIIALVGRDLQEHIHAAFAREFFSCGGFDTEILSFPSVEAALEKLLFTDCRIIVFASQEKDYQRFSGRFQEALRAHKNRPDLILAAPPEEMKQELQDHGFDGYLFRNCDVSEISSRIQEKLLRELT